MTDSSEIGRYGTLRLLKRHEPDTTVAFFPIDDEEVTFGRSKQCSVRLYYDCVSELHCTLQISEQRKAFLLVQGTNGLLVDGCQVNPSTTGSTTVPLTNGSEIEIYKKRFKFEYPPKEIRAALLATPRHGKSRRSLRMSLIRSAQVITPRSNTSAPRNPRRGSIKDNVEWEALRSPVKVSGSGSDKQEVMLLEGQGDDAMVVEEEKDLIILEQVDNPFQEQEMASGSLHRASNTGRPVTPPPRSIPAPQSVRGVQNAPQTPPMVRRRSAQSLHRAVVLRSAQRAQLERQRYEEQEEEDEVEAVVSPERELGPFELSSDEEEYDDEEEEHEQPNITSNAAPQPSGSQSGAFRAGLGVVKKAFPLPFSWRAPEAVPYTGEQEEEEEDEEEEAEEEDEGLHEEADAGTYTAHTQTPVRRNLGAFMTPQIMLNRRAQRVPVDAKARASIGGEGIAPTFRGAQRVRTVSPWKIQDIVLPEPGKPHVAEKQKEARNRITEDERQEIMARRKSALQTPTLLPKPGPRGSTFPPPRPSDMYTPGEDKDEDAETMVENMLQKMAQVKRKTEARKMRLSITSPHKAQDFSLLSAGPRRASRAIPVTGIEEETLSQTKRAELDEDVFTDAALDNVDVRHSNEGQDKLNLLDGSRNSKLTSHTPIRAASKPTASLTPRFDGVREMFRQPPLEPKTPAFHGFREMFYPPGPKSVLATPQLNLGDMFSNEDETKDIGSCSGEDLGNLDSEGTSDDSIMLHDDHSSHAATRIKAEVDQPAVLDPIPEASRRSRKAASPRTDNVKGKGIRAVNVPSAVAEDYKDEEHSDQDLEPKTAVTTRRTAKRSANKTNTQNTDEVGDGGRRSRTRKGVATTTAGVSNATALPKGRRTRKAIVVESDEEPANTKHMEPVRRKRATKNHEVSDDHNEADVEGLTAHKTRLVGGSDTKGIKAPKARRGRAAKIQQPIPPVDAPPATTTRVTRHVATDDTPDNEGHPHAAKPRAKRGAKTKAPDDGATIQQDDHSSEPEEATPAPSNGRRGKRGKAAVPQDETSDDKENTEGHQGEPIRKRPTTRGRKAPVATATEALDAPAKRTRSRK
ncbi:hypothetical protein JB92DRAFT_3124063 [Gautieria morchelliformis]|nr:hypothetical protein JB92DRAFT_3124063 [Gautieria morchelliformis]